MTIRKKDYDENYKTSSFYRRRIKRVAKITACAVPLILIVGSTTFIGFKYHSQITGGFKSAEQIVQTMSIDDFKQYGTSHIYDINGTEMFKLINERSVEYLNFNDIPSNVSNAFISIEDKRFYSHNGIDYISLARASLAFLKNKGHITQGGSTLTQQLVKLTYLTSEQSIQRKISEMLLARDLEKKFTKQQIMEFYCNSIYFGNNYYGINAASLAYFQKPVKDLTLSQTAFLCAIPNSPEKYNPFKFSDGFSVNKNTIVRRDLILANMLADKFISQTEYDAALQEEIIVTRESNDFTSYDTRKDFITKEVIELLMKADGFHFIYDFKTDQERQDYIATYNDRYKKMRARFFKGGYNIYTSFDETLQSKTQKAVDDLFKGQTAKTEEGIFKRQVASLTLDNKTGLIKTMIGGRTSSNIDYLNRAYAVQRQNGSTMKPLAVYAPALELTDYLPCSIINDSQEENGPKNSGSAYYGDVTLRDAVRWSLNTVAYKVYRQVTPSKGLSYLKNMDFEYIVPEDATLASGLGGLTIGTNVQEVAGGYACLANSGQFNKPSCISEIKDSSGKTLYKHSIENKRVYAQATSDMMISILNTAATQGTGKGSSFNPNIEVAGKTGTTDDNKDLWFAGFTSEYTTVVWTGYDQPQAFNATSSDSPINTWKTIMSLLYNTDSTSKLSYSSSTKFVYVNALGQHVADSSEGGHLDIFPEAYTVPEAPVVPEVSTEAEKELTTPNEEKDKMLQEMESIEKGEYSTTTSLDLAKKNLDILVDKIKESSALTKNDKEDLIAYANYISTNLREKQSANTTTIKTDRGLKTVGTPENK